MKTFMLIGIIIIAIWIVIFSYQGITNTTRGKVVEFGPIQLTAETTKTLLLPPDVGAISLAGIVVTLLMRRKNG